MKPETKYMIMGYVGLLGLVTLLIILHSIQGLLPAIAVKVLIALLVLAGLCSLYLLYWLYSHFHKTYHGIQSRRYELKASQQSLEIERERWEIEKHLLLTRAAYDANGNPPIIMGDTRIVSPRELDVLLLPAGQIRGNRARPLELAQEAESLQDELPNVVRYEQIAGQIPRGHVLLGVSANGVETCDFGQLMTMWICGGSSTGKSNTVALKIDEAIRNGRDIRLLVIDPHARKEDSLYNKIRGYERYFLARVAVTEEEIFSALQWFHEEFKRRLDQGGAATDILLVVDEVSNVVESEDERIGKLVKKIARICGQESRGFGMFGWFISQRAAGLAWLRNVAITVITHKMNMMSERKLACNEDMELARSMDKWPRGRVAIYGIGFEGSRTLQMAVFTPPVVDAGRGSGAVYVEEATEMEPLQSLPTSTKTDFQTQQREDAGRLAEDNGEASGRRYTAEDLNNPLVLKKFLNEAGKMRQGGASIDAILKHYGLTPGGRNNQNLKALLDGQGDQAAEA